MTNLCAKSCLCQKTCANDDHSRKKCWREMSDLKLHGKERRRKKSSTSLWGKASQVEEEDVHRKIYFPFHYQLANSLIIFLHVFLVCSLFPSLMFQGEILEEENLAIGGRIYAQVLRKGRRFQEEMLERNFQILYQLAKFQIHLLAHGSRQFCL